MEKLIAYFVKAECDDPVLDVGDYVWVSENGNLNLFSFGDLEGWLIPSEWEGIQIECKPSKEYFVDCCGERETLRRIIL